MKLPSEVYNYNYYYDWDNPSEMTEAIMAAERALIEERDASIEERDASIERAEKAEKELKKYKWENVSQFLPTNNEVVVCRELII